MPGVVTVPDRGIDQLTDRQLERLAEVDRSAVLDELNRRESQRRKEEQRRAEETQRSRQTRLAAQAVEQLDDDDLEAVAERPQRPWQGGGRLAVNTHRASRHLPDGEHVGQGTLQEAAQREREKRERQGSPEARRRRRARQAQRRRAQEAQQPATVTIAGREIPTVALGIALILAATQL